MTDDDIPEQSPGGRLRARLRDLEELRLRINRELAEVRYQVARLEGSSPRSLAARHAANVTPDDITAGDVRTWGKAHGWELGDRGRLPADLIAAYLERPREDRE